MNSWWGALSSDEKLFWAAAIVSTLLFTIQIILVFMGGDTDSEAEIGGHIDVADSADLDLDVHADAHGDMHAEGGHFDTIMGYFTIRNLTAFFMGFGWGGLSMKQRGYGTLPTTLVAALVGLVFVFFVMMIMKAMSKLKDEGTLSIANAVGATGTVAINIPEEMKGTGKVSVVVQGRLIDIEAVTREEEMLTRGQHVKVSEVSGNKLIVSKS